MKKDDLSPKVSTIIKAIQAADIIEITYSSKSSHLKLWNRIDLIDNNEYYISLIRPYGDDGETENNVILYESLDSATVKNNQISVKDEDDQPVIIAIFAKVEIDIDIL
jgi:hypothetical protein